MTQHPLFFAFVRVHLALFIFMYGCIESTSGQFLDFTKYHHDYVSTFLHKQFDDDSACLFYHFLKLVFNDGQL